MYMGALIYYYHWLDNQPLFAGFGFPRMRARATPDAAIEPGTNGPT